MSTETEASPRTDLDALSSEAEPDKATQALADAQEEIAQLKDKMREERMGWIVLCTLIFDCFLFLNASNWSGPIVIGLIEFGALSVIAARLGIEEFAAIFNQMISRVTHLIAGRG